MKFKNILTDRAQRVDEKNGVIRLVMFPRRVMVFKISKMTHFVYFLQETGEDLALSEKAMDYVLWNYH